MVADRPHRLAGFVGSVFGLDRAAGEAGTSWRRRPDHRTPEVCATLIREDDRAVAIDDGAVVDVVADAFCEGGTFAVAAEAGEVVG